MSTEIQNAAGSDTGAIASLAAPDADRMAQCAPQIAGLLKALSHEGRLMILCHLAAADRSVTELEQLLGQRQAAVSQQLARLRAEGLVRARRDGKTIRYSLSDGPAQTMIEQLYRICCAEA
ncbi:MAG TPA: metalloregulator ArsR/SmtB family transcription factor [Paenirhodobacter sp.]